MLRLWVAPIVILVACGGASATSTSTLSLQGSGSTPEDPVLACHVGPERSDYAFVSHYVCPDGTVPLQGDPGRGAAARIGNIGQGADGHVIDEYEVPCRPSPQRVYVDAYHCEEGVEDEIDPTNVPPEALAGFARFAREAESVPFGERVEAMRMGMVEFLGETSQVHVEVCPAIWARIATDDYRFAQLVRAQFIASLGAGVIETSDGPEDRLRNNLLAVEGLVRLYAAMLEQAGQVAAFAPLDELSRVSAQGELAAHVGSLLAECDAPQAGFSMQTDGQDVWPPQGPGCERLVTCCEGQGLVQNGAAVSGHPGGLMCLLGAAGAADCEGAIQALAASGVVCAP